MCWMRRTGTTQNPEQINNRTNVVPSALVPRRTVNCGADGSPVACHGWGKKVLAGSGWPIGKIDRHRVDGAAFRPHRPRRIGGRMTKDVGVAERYPTLTPSLPQIRSGMSMIVIGSIVWSALCFLNMCKYGGSHRTRGRFIFRPASPIKSTALLPSSTREGREE